MPLYLIRLTPTRAGMVREGPTPSEAAIIGEHFAYLKSACDRGEVLLFGRTANHDEATVGLCLVRAADESAALAFMRADPCVRGGVMRARLDEYRLAGFNASALES